MKKKILAITPFFGRSGSEIALFNLLDSVKKEFEISIFTEDSKAELKNELPDEIQFISKNQIKLSYTERVLSKFSKILFGKSKFTSANNVFTSNRYDVLFLNTLLSLSYYEKLKDVSKFKILYVHEAEDFLFYLNVNHIEFMLNEVDLILCSSNMVRDYLVRLGRSSNIHVLYPSFNFEKIQLHRKRRAIRKDLNINSDTFIWAMSGDININKNPKMFIQVAERLLNKNVKVAFVWIGVSNRNNAYEFYLQKMVKSMKLSDKVLFLKKQSQDYYYYINEIDGFILTSFSESYSLVAKESACFNKPVVSFPCGGVVESVPKSHLFQTSNYSIDEMVCLIEAIMKMKKDDYKLIDYELLFSNDKIKMSNKFMKILSEYSNC